MAQGLTKGPPNVMKSKCEDAGCQKNLGRDTPKTHATHCTLTSDERHQAEEPRLLFVRSHKLGHRLAAKLGEVFGNTGQHLRPQP